MKAYCCNKWPFLKLGAKVAFREGLFETDDVALQELIEASDSYGVHIHPRDAAPDEIAQPSARAGRRGSR
jgi:hypothetical protein